MPHDTEAARPSRTKIRRGSGHGELRAAILLLLDEWPMTAAALIRVISERSGALWTVGGSMMRSALSSLEDEGMVSTARVGGRAKTGLTGAGTTYVDKHRGALGEPWDDIERRLLARAADPGPSWRARRPGPSWRARGRRGPLGSGAW